MILIFPTETMEVFNVFEISTEVINWTNDIAIWRIKNNFSGTLHEIKIQ